tara:strand:- start:28 stop:597 length:570 start_codon:yes stop_codon:yes gene_type:complete
MTNAFSKHAVSFPTALNASGCPKQRHTPLWFDWKVLPLECVEIILKFAEEGNVAWWEDLRFNFRPDGSVVPRRHLREVLKSITFDNNASWWVGTQRLGDAEVRSGWWENLVRQPEPGWDALDFVRSRANDRKRRGKGNGKRLCSTCGCAGHTRRDCPVIELYGATVEKLPGQSATLCRSNFTNGKSGWD